MRLRVHLVSALPRLAALALVAAGCRTVRPSSLDQWHVCLADLQSVSYLHLSTRWDPDPFSMEHQGAFLHVELPGPLTEGAEIRFSGGKPPAVYREGSEGLDFDSSTFEGTIRVVRVGVSTVELALDLRAVSPKVDIQKRGFMPFRGTLTVDRQKGDGICR